MKDVAMPLSRAFVGDEAGYEMDALKLQFDAE
jgi:hypothetical protein